ncbi:hypothetical protein HBO08_27620 [Pseudomonas rhodesiae]|nr:hypothetical protein [Pseudomonas rhodesiae]
MPTLQDETLPQRYAREHQDYLKLCGSMTAEQVADLQLQLHNALAAAPSPPQPIFDEAKERELFERSVQDKAERFQPDFTRYGLHSDAEYRDANMQWAWELWSIRAKAVEVGHE